MEPLFLGGVLEKLGMTKKKSQAGPTNEQIRQRLSELSGVPVSELCRVKPFLKIESDLDTRVGLLMAVGQVVDSPVFPLSDSENILVSPSVQTMQQVFAYIQTIDTNYLSVLGWGNTISGYSSDPKDWVGESEAQNQQSLDDMAATLKREIRYLQDVVEILNQRQQQQKTYSLPGRAA